MPCTRGEYECFRKTGSRSCIAAQGHRRRVTEREGAAGDHATLQCVEVRLLRPVAGRTVADLVDGLVERALERAVLGEGVLLEEVANLAAAAHEVIVGRAVGAGQTCEELLARVGHGRDHPGGKRGRTGSARAWKTLKSPLPGRKPRPARPCGSATRGRCPRTRSSQTRKTRAPGTRRAGHPRACAQSRRDAPCRSSQLLAAARKLADAVVLR